MPARVEPLDDATIERAGELVAREQAAARRTCPELPEAYQHPDTCTAALQRLRDTGHSGLVATDRDRVVAVLTATMRLAPDVGRYARLPAEGLAVDPELEDPTAVLGTLYAELAPPLLDRDVRRHYLLHVARPPVEAAVANLGFGRDGVYGVRPLTPRRDRPAVPVRVAGPAELDSVARLALVEIEHREAAPMFGPRSSVTLAELVDRHRALRDGGAVHLLASVDGRDAGLLTIELTSPVPRLCAADQPYIGPTATAPEFRRRGVGQALVDAALGWAEAHGYRWLSVDFASANPLSRPFWLGAGFRPTGYGVLRLLDPR